MATTLASNSLVTLDEYREFLGLPDKPQGRTAASGSAIHLNSAIDEMEQYTERKFQVGSVTTRTEVFSGLGYNDRYDWADQRYAVEHFPVIENEATWKLEYRSDWSLEEDDDNAWTEVSGSKYYVDFTDGHVHMVGENYFCEGNRNYRFSYQSGWSAASDFPTNLKDIQMKLAKLNQMEAEHMVVSSTTHGEKTKSYDFDGNRARLLRRLDKYKRPNRDRGV